MLPGDRLVVFTDGLYERRGANIDIGLTHLMFVVEQSRRHSDTSEACQGIIDDMIVAHHEDDVCLMVADFSGPVGGTNRQET
jgi:serine phosphatase RsbU (regulator of sigma subunit)